MKIRYGWSALLVLLTISIAGPAMAQQTTITTPSNTAGHSFFEHFNVNFGFSTSGPDSNFFFNNGGGGAVVPPFGGFDPNSSANIGGAVVSGNSRFSLNVSAGQGSDTSMVSQSPSVTLMNGQIGTITDTIQRPFVTSIIPVVGEPVSPLEEKLARLYQEGTARRRSTTTTAATAKDDQPLVIGKRGSSASRAEVTSVAEIRRQQAIEDAAEANAKADEISDLIAKARAAEKAKKAGAARIYYQMAAKLATGSQKTELEKKSKPNE